MRIDPDTCRDPDLLAAEVRRLQAVIDAAMSPASTGSAEEPTIEGTLRLTHGQWVALVQHVRNDEALMEVGLAPQIGRQAMNKIHSTADAIVAEIERATGVFEPIPG